MLDEVEIRNFKCFPGVRVPLRPLTVLIGPNDSGKTAFLSAVEHLVAGHTQREFVAEDVWRGERCEIELIGKTANGQIGATDSENRVRRPESESSIRQELLPVQRFQLPSSGVAMQCAGYSQKEEASLPIDVDGKRLAALLDYFLRRERKRFFSLIDVLKANIPGLEDIEISTPNPQERRIDLVIDGGLRVRADQASVGVRMLLFFASLAHHPRPPRTILLEEPETGVHPRRLGDLMKLLHSIVEGRLANHAAQVILTTHSPYLLDFVDLDNDQVLVFQRTDDGSRTALPVDKNRLKAFIDEFMLGEIWFNQEEAGLVAKP